MAPVRRVSPVEAKALIDAGYAYVDVRTEEEFHARHPAGSLNVPLSMTTSGGGPAPAGFLATMERLFSRDAKIVVGCAVGGRSLRAAEVLGAAGFTDVVDQRAGMEGARSPFGSLLEPGWADAGLPVATGPDEGSLAVIQQDRAR